MFPQIISAAPSAANTAGAAIQSPALVDAFVNFRPKPDWRAEEYGFDWVRDEDYESYFGPLPRTVLVDASIQAKYAFSKNVGFSFLNGAIESGAEISPKGQFRFDKPMFDKLLTQEYKKFTVEFNKIKTDNFVSYLSVFMESDSPKTVEVQIQVKKLVAPVKLEYKADLSVFTFDPADPPKHTTAALSRGSTSAVTNPATVKITLKKKLTADVTVEVVAVTPANGSQPETRQTVGKLIVVKNAVVKPLNALLINVKTKTFSSAGLNQGLQDFARNCFKQASIDLKFITDPKASSLNVSANTDFNNNYISNDTVVLDAMDNLKGQLDAGHFCFKKWSETNSPQAFANHIKIFCFDRPLAFVSGGILTHLGGVHVGDKIVLVEPDPVKTTVTLSAISKTVLPHEMLHAVGIAHTFAAGPPKINSPANANALFTYKAFSTENIMDYSVRDGGEKCALYHWQWVVAFNKV